VSIRFDLESRRSVDDETGDYLEHHFRHWQDPLHYYELHSKEGELRLSASTLEIRSDTRGDGTVGLITADVHRISMPHNDGTLQDISDDQHPAVRRFVEFLEVWLFERRAIPQQVVITTKLGNLPPASPM
jgi:hypothetical protein